MYKNLIALFANQGFSYVLPILILPYLVRVLGFDKYGYLVLVQSVMQFAIIIVDYGFNYTATTRISIYRHNHAFLQKLFYDIVRIKIIIGITCGLVMLPLTFLLPQISGDWEIYAIGFISVIGSVFYPVWLFQGTEKMVTISVINVVTKIITTTSLFIFINEPDDYIRAIFLQTLNYLIPGVAMFVLAIYKFQFRKIPQIKIKDIKLELINGWSIFSTTLMGNVYGQGALIAVGFLTTSFETAQFAIIQKISSAIVGIFHPPAQALLPRLSLLWSQMSRRFYEIRNKALLYSMIFSVAIPFAVIISSPLIIKLVTGQTDAETVEYMRYFSSITGIVIMNVMMNSFITAMSLYKYMQKIYFLAATIFFILALPLTIIYGVKGMISGIFLTEGSILITSAFVIFYNSEYIVNHAE